MVAARAFLFALVSLFLLQAASGHAAEIKVFVDQDQLLVDQSFQLFFEATGSVDADPDFSPLERDFEIRGRNQSSSTSIINGSYSSKKTWILTLLAKNPGTLKIPPIPFGRVSSPPLALTINTTASAGQSSGATDIFLDVSAEPKTVYPQQRLTYSVKLFRRVEISNASLSEPEFSGVDCSFEKLGKDREFETIRDGRRYLVIERQYAIFPQQSGDLLIKPLRFEGQLLQSQRSFFGAMNQPGPIKRLTSAPLSLKVKPLPAAIQGKQWLPAENLQLRESWSTEPAQLVAGEPTTRTLTLTVQGLPASQLPELSMGNLPGFKLYPDQPLLENNQDQQPPVASRQEKIALIPTRAGEFQLPEVRIDWWNTRTDRPETAVLPAVTLQVAAPPASQALPPEPAALPQQPSGQLAEGAARKTAPESRFWPLLTALSAGGWLLTALAWWHSRRRTSAEKPAANLPPAAGQAEKRLQAACHSNDPTLAKSALLDWGRQLWPERPAPSLTEIGNRCSALIAKEIETLNRALYAHGSRDWQGGALWQAFQQHKPLPAGKKRRKPSPLADLHP